MLAKFKKAGLVIFITCLIWIWADLSLDKDLTGQTMTIIASKADPQLWVTIDGKTEIQVKADLRGPSVKVSELNRKIQAGEEKLDVIFDPAKENMETPGKYSLPDVRKFLAESEKIQEYGLTVKFAHPDKLDDIQVVALKEKTLPIKCVDEMDNEIPSAKITPDIITMYAPDQVTESKVKLPSATERKQARAGSITKNPYIELAKNEVRYSDATVKVELPAISEDMKPYTIRGTLGFTFSANLVGRYEVEFIKRPEVGGIPILATPEARDAYEQKQFEVLLDIQDDDVGKPEVTRQINYNFPTTFLREDKIRLRGDPAEAKFRLVPVIDPNQNGLMMMP
ncbi:MAG: hypothetical protein A2Y10_11115 [Planctomycetes bacterium GWF2_41_51]|nr:MAG: hypothetical protein A2Y10_11115 [Planctomycetes bacterium GWF2_41_51]HBG28401.1 hypothetical protein [Phycisphaerales bacterium]